MNTKIAFTLACALSLSLEMPAQPPHPPAPPFMTMEELGLTETQRQAVHAVFERHRAARQEKEKAAFAKERALHEAVEDTKVSEAQLKALHADLSDARLQLVLDQRAVFVEILAVLTPEQQAKARTLRPWPDGGPRRMPQPGGGQPPLP